MTFAHLHDIKNPPNGPHPLPASRHAPERVPASVYATSAAASVAVAAEIAQLLRERAAQGRTAALGLATGSTPQNVYDELVRLHREEGLSFANVIAFNLDEYWPMQPDDLQSYRRFMQEHLFDHVDIDPAHTHVPGGTIERGAIAEYCVEYERKMADAGGIDIQLLGVGRTGHIGFNEPGSARDSRTRLISLDRITRRDAASDFFGEWNVPRHALTIGVGTILEARRIILMAFGEHKAAIIRRAVEGDVTPSVAASFLQQHGGARIVLDPAAAAELTRFKTPWTLGPMADLGLAWDHFNTRKAVIWLARTLNKAVLKLTDEDYNEHHLQELLALGGRGGSGGGGQRGGAYEINIDVFRSLQKTITGWPAGKPGDANPVGQASVPAGTVRAQRPAPPPASEVSARIFPKRVVVFSPHPDDDVISMGGTLIRLCEQGHEVHVAYQTSGNIAVWDESALRHIDFVRAFSESFPPPQAGGAPSAAHSIEHEVERFISTKKPGDPDTPELQKIKTLIRRSEARAAARYSGVKPECIHFLDLPFYETGRVRKKPIGAEDIRIIADLLARIQPQQIYAAGDLSDPHGTHRTCLAAITAALAQLAQQDWMQSCIVWLYRGAWQEWDPEEIEMAVPLSPDEVERKRRAIFKHESQKDIALFPGPNDPREFWQRAEDRNRNTAQIYDQLGLAEYEAIEGFVRMRNEAR